MPQATVKHYFKSNKYLILDIIHTYFEKQEKLDMCLLSISYILFECFKALKAIIFYCIALKGIHDLPKSQK